MMGILALGTDGWAMLILGAIAVGLALTPLQK